MPACHGYSTIENAVAKALDSAWKKGLPSFFAYLERIIQNMEKESTTENCIRATAFCPLSDQPDLLKCTKTKIVRDGVIFDGIQVDGVKYAKFLRARFIRDWNTCCDCGADIMFAPEMLGTRELDERNGRFHKLLGPLSMEALAQKKKPPCLQSCRAIGAMA